MIRGHGRSGGKRVPGNKCPTEEKILPWIKEIQECVFVYFSLIGESVI